MKKEKRKIQTGYRIKLKGTLPQQWKEWFEDWTISYEGRDTILCGEIKDQSFLHGTLNKIRDLNLILLSVEALGTKNMEDRK